jgi:catechol 2,3-dioxygenase-like lactoylglutathione lyase family enzyme
MIDHFTLSVPNLKKSVKFYSEALKPLGYGVMLDFGEIVGLGAKMPRFWLKQSATPQSPQHIAFKAKDRKAVDAFHKAALKAGAKDDGQPGVRAQYHENYYGAFVLDPDGHPIEAVCHAADEKKKSKKDEKKKKKKK